MARSEQEKPSCSFKEKGAYKKGGGTDFVSLRGTLPHWKRS